MAFLYALSDPHGRLDVLDHALGSLDLGGENQLFMLGDYIPHEGIRYGEDEFVALCAESLDFVRSYCERHEGHVHALMGNHEFALLESVWNGWRAFDQSLLAWTEHLALYYETERQIFVHAGIDEDAEDLWKYGTWEFLFVGKYPPTFGSFSKDIVAGHVAAFKLARDARFEGAFWDGESHYFISASTDRTGRLPILRYDTETGAYSCQVATADGVRPAEIARRGFDC